VISLATLVLACSDGTDVNRSFNVRVDDAVLPVLVRGNLDRGTVALYVQGGPGLASIQARLLDAYLWEDSLEDDVAFAYYDARGTGNALGRITPEELTLDQAASDLVAVTRAVREVLDVDDVALLSHSWGGTVSARALAAGAPADAWVSVAGVMSYGTPTGFEHRVDFVSRVARSFVEAGDDDPIWAELLALSDDGLTYGSDGDEAALEDALAAIEQRLNLPDEPPLGGGFLRTVFFSRVNVIDALMRPWSFEPLLLDTVDGTDHYTSLARVEVPTLHVAGQYDDIAPVEQAQEARDAMATGLAQVQVLEGTGHSPQLQRPRAFADAVGAFLTGRVRP